MLQHENKACVCVYRVYNIPMNSKEVMKKMKKAGWTVSRIKGSHHQMTHPDFAHTVTVPHPKKELGKGLVKAIFKQAGLKE